MDGEYLIFEREKESHNQQSTACYAVPVTRGSYFDHCTEKLAVCASIAQNKHNIAVLVAVLFFYAQLFSYKWCPHVTSAFMEYWG